MAGDGLREAAVDDILERLKAAVEVETVSYLWVEGDTPPFVPRVLPKVYGDGRALFRITTINQRPRFWVIRGDSGWDCSEYGAPDDAPDFGDFTDEIMDDLEDEFGRGRCGYSGESLFWPKGERGCQCEECQEEEIAVWPTVDDDGGCSWGRMDWPKGFATAPHAWSRFGILLTAAPNPLEVPDGQ